MDKNGLIHNSFAISPWMNVVLGLKGVDLMVFSVVYSVSRTGQGQYFGGTKYIKDIFGLHKSSVIDSFARLVEKKYLVKVENYENKVYKPRYYANIELINDLIDQYLTANYQNCSDNVQSEIPTGVVGKNDRGWSEIPTGVVGKNDHNNNKDNYNKEINNNNNTNEDLPTNLFGDESLDSGKDEELKAEFDKFRKKYPGAGKLGLETEWDYFKKKHKDYKKIVPILNDSLDVIIIRRDSRKKLKLFVPEWKYFRTWINGRCWEEALEESEADIQAKKIIDVKLGVGEKIEDGRRTYGTGRVTVPMDARPRPAENYQWSNPQNDWVYSV